MSKFTKLGMGLQKDVWVGSNLCDSYLRFDMLHHRRFLRNYMYQRKQHQKAQLEGSVLVAMETAGSTAYCSWCHVHDSIAYGQ